MRAENEKSRRLRAAASPESDHAASGSTKSLTVESVAAAAFRGAYAVLVRTDDRSTRSLFLSLSAAERKADRVRARGGRADLVLLRMVPVDDRELDALAGGAS